MVEHCQCALLSVYSADLNSVLIPQDAPKARQQFVTSGALARLQSAVAGLDPKGKQYAEAIQALFPPDVVAYYEQGRR